jgi:hypothetical protein
VAETLPHLVSFMMNEFEEPLPPNMELGFTTLTIFQFCAYAQYCQRAPKTGQ